MDYDRKRLDELKTTIGLLPAKRQLRREDIERRIRGALTAESIRSILTDLMLEVFGEA